jgi:SAM-dependent methyltransferase
VIREKEPASAFYDTLAPLFDVMTDWDARLATEEPFLLAMLEQTAARRVLDVACGSGGHALALARRGYQVVGADVSPTMIELARQKAAAAGLDARFFVSDLAALRERTGSSGQAAPYDAVLCLGNSLPHLLSQEALNAALRGIAAVLRPGGLFITQNLNYDLRWRTQPRWFAAQGGVHNGQEALVWRFADYEVAARRIAFHIALFRKGEQGWEVQVHTTPQRPLFQADLVAGLAAAGFGEWRAYGRMALPAEPFDPERSADLVVVARKMAGG